MRLVHTVFLLALGTSPALAQTGPVIVIPGRPDVPIIENGVDVSWSVVESELGLARPGVLTPTVIYRPPPPIFVPYARASYQPGFFPSSGKTPGYGRLEQEPSPDQPPPKPAQSYRRSWSSHSANTPADLPSTNPYGPMYISPIIAPSFNGPSQNGLSGNGPASGQPNGPPGARGMQNGSFNEAPGLRPGDSIPRQPSGTPGARGMQNGSFNEAPRLPPAGSMPGQPNGPPAAPGMQNRSFNEAPGLPPGGSMPGRGMGAR